MFIYVQIIIGNTEPVQELFLRPGFKRPPAGEIDIQFPDQPLLFNIDQQVAGMIDLHIEPSGARGEFQTPNLLAPRKRSKAFSSRLITHAERILIGTEREDMIGKRINWSIFVFLLFRRSFPLMTRLTWSRFTMACASKSRLTTTSGYTGVGF